MRVPRECLILPMAEFRGNSATYYGIHGKAMKGLA